MNIVFEFACESCYEKFDGLMRHDEVSDTEENTPCPECGGKLKRVWTFGYGKFNGAGFTRRSTNG